MAKPGDRIGAISHSDGDTLHLYGYGEYLGEFFPPKGTQGPFGIDASEVGCENPCMRLDSGRIIWGCQCWWGSEDSVRERAAKFDKVVEDEPPDNPAVLECDSCG